MFNVILQLGEHRHRGHLTLLFRGYATIWLIDDAWGLIDVLYIIRFCIKQGKARSIITITTGDKMVHGLYRGSNRLFLYIVAWFWSILSIILSYLGNPIAQRLRVGLFNYTDINEQIFTHNKAKHKVRLNLPPHHQPFFPYQNPYLYSYSQMPTI